MLNLNIPALIEVREGITVNLALSVSQAIEHDVPQYTMKEEVKKLQEEQKLNRRLTSEDYDEIGKTDTVTFWFIDGKSLTYRVGEEITAEQFEEVSKDILALTYKRKK